MVRQLTRPLAVFLCVSLLVPALPLAAWPPVITIETGQPSVWSLAQAHYLLAQIHQKNRALSTPLLTEAQLDPNRANASRLEVIRTLLGIEAQFDQGIGVQNGIALQNFRDAQAKRNAARITLEERQAQRQQVDSEVVQLNEQIARLAIEDQIADQARGTAAPSAADSERKQTLAVLKAHEAAQKAERDRLDAEITSLKTDANAVPASPTLATSPVSSTAGSLPTSAALSKFTDKALDEALTPSLAASTALDNSIDMQYEILSKQLTLLRDEVGPDERVIFLELPTSIYTTDKWADGYVGQVEWQVTGYYDKEPSYGVKRESIKENLLKTGRRESEISELIQDLDDHEKDSPEYPVTLDMVQRVENRDGFKATELPIPEKQCSAKNSEPGTPALKTGVRALEIIPRQSALNVNENHAITNNFSILGVLKLISGFGAKLDFQRQREVYEKFLQQKAFASGFGQGSNVFGWTFGPLPGSNRIEPGQRTTYAVLAVPRNTLVLELMAITRAYSREQSPCLAKNVHKARYRMLVPGEATERFWIHGITYAPVSKGRRVTVLIDGDFFSPQLGVMVNGVPLKRALSISRAGIDEPVSAGIGQGVEGEYEITNSREIILNFSMGSEFIGTPTITLVSPEKSNAINSFKLVINHHGRGQLKEHSVKEPMFTEAFGIDAKLEKLARDGKVIKARLRGTGLLPNADVSVNGKVTTSSQESTHSYFVSFEDDDPPAKSWRVRYRQNNLQGFDEKEFEQPQPAGPKFEAVLRNYSPGRPAEADLTVVIPDKDVKQAEITLEDPRSGRCHPPNRDMGGAFRVKCRIRLTNGGAERDFISVKAVGKDAYGKPLGVPQFADIRLPVRPQILTLKNLLTGKPSGFANDEATVIIKGVNLQHVTGVLFGDKEAQITVPADLESLTVKVSKAEVPKGQKSAVPVVLRTDSGLLVSAGTYVYEGEPLPKAAAWPYPRPGRH